MLLGVIPARGGSKGIPKKNLHPLNGKPLIEYTIEAAKKSELDDVVLTTDDFEILARGVGCFQIMRPQELAQDDTPMIPVVQHAVLEYEGKTGKSVDVVVLLQPTSPLRTTYDIDRALITFLLCGRSSLYSGYYLGLKKKTAAYDKHQDVAHFQRNGAIFIAKSELIRQGLLWASDVCEMEMPKTRSIDIDDMEDMEIAEALLRMVDNG